VTQEQRETDPVEYQHYGPPPNGTDGGWQESAPAWSTRPPVAAAPEPDRRRPGMVGVVAVALVVGIVSGTLSSVAVSNLLQPSPLAQPSGGGANVVTNRLQETSAVINAVRAVTPAVVTITSQSGSSAAGNGIGSGFIFDANGWILTNRHVVDGADTLSVRLNDTRSFPATVYGIDTLTDLAIIRVQASGLPAAKLGSSADLQPGQVAIAIGNPLGDFENTVTTGVVSGLGRQITAGDAANQSSERLNHLIQTDAAINPGNSGGPLVDSDGAVIGINTAVNQDAQGIGFAIPIDFAKPILAQALAGKPIARPWIGVFYTDVTKGLAQERKLSVDYGALVSSSDPNAPAVFAGSPAAAAGVKDGDVVLEIDGTRVDETHDLSSLIIPHDPGDTVTLKILRDGSERTLKVTLGTLPRQNG
jgi:S1-C subfamily serine protease